MFLDSSLTSQKKTHTNKSGWVLNSVLQSPSLAEDMCAREMQLKPSQIPKNASLLSSQCLTNSDETLRNA
jgi:hypothetical protein